MIYLVKPSFTREIADPVRLEQTPSSVRSDTTPRITSWISRICANTLLATMMRACHTTALYRFAVFSQKGGERQLLVSSRKQGKISGGGQQSTRQVPVAPITGYRHWTPNSTTKSPAPESVVGLHHPCLVLKVPDSGRARAGFVVIVLEEYARVHNMPEREKRALFAKLYNKWKTRFRSAQFALC